MWPLNVFCDPTWRPLAATLLHFVWQGLVVAAAWKVLFRCFRGCRAQTEYVLGVAGLLVLTACPIVSFALLDSNGSAGSAWRLPSPFGRGAGGEGLADSPTRPHPNSLPKGEGTTLAAAEKPAAWQDAVQQWADASQPYLIGGWIAGLAILSGRLLFGAISARRLRRGRRPVSAALADRIAVLAERLGLKMVPGVYVSDVVCDALVTGLLRPMILLPAAWLLEMTPDVLEAVIAHELAHVRRFDQWVNLFQRVVETVLFYHPAVWWLSHRVRVVREMCCDEMAVAATGERVVYATALEFAARRRLAPEEPLLEVALGATRMTLLSRVRNVLGLPDGERKGRWWPTIVLGLFVLLVIGFAAALVGQRKYRADYLLEVSMQDKPIAFATDTPGVVDRDRFEIYKNTQVQSIRSRFVLMAALRNRDVAKLPSVQQAQRDGDPEHWLERRLDITFPGKAEIMVVSVYDDDPQVATVLVRAIVSAYMREVVDNEREQKRNRLNELDRAFVEKEQEIRGKREDLKRLAETFGTSDTEMLTTKQKLALETLSIYRQELAKTQLELQRLQDELAVQQSLLKGADTLNIDDEVDLLMEADPIAAPLLAKLETPKDSSDAKALQDQLHARRAKLVALERKKRRLAARKEIQRLEPATAALAKGEQSQQKIVDEYQREAEKFGSSTVDIEMSRADIKNLERTMATIGDEREKLKVEIRSTPRVTAPFGPAMVPEKPVWWW